ncbi:hypothetical protein IG631_17920 [Alternaria alternata]|nr:hypothetical protein IG631_17920 [Alternaria alternata]
MAGQCNNAQEMARKKQNMGRGRGKCHGRSSGLGGLRRSNSVLACGSWNHQPPRRRTLI